MTKMRLSQNLIVTTVVLLGMAVLPLGAGGYVLGLLTLAYYYGVFAMSWDLLFGYAGEVNFGPSFLVGLGAYTAGLLNHYYELPIWLCLIAGTSAAIIGGLLLAVPALRLTGPYFGLVTMVAVLLLQNTIVLFSGITGGEIGLSLPDVLVVGDRENYYLASGFMVVSGALLLAYARSPGGLILQASGQDSTQAAALGFNVAKHKLAAFCISALFSGLAGAMLVFYLGTASVGTVVDIAVGVQVIIAAVMGGRRTIVGAAIGAAFLIIVGELLRPIGHLSTFVVSGCALVVILFFPSGLMGFLQRAERRE